MLRSMPDKQGGTQTTVALIGVNALMQLGLQTLIKSEMWIRLLGQFFTVLNFVEMIAREKPHVIIIDAQCASDLPRLIHKIKDSVPQPKIILLCGSHNVERCRQALGLGIDGLVLNNQPVAVLIATIKHVAGRTMQSMEDFTANPSPINVPDGPAVISGQIHRRKGLDLSERERRIIKLVGEGYSNKEIADWLNIADSTVRHHLTKIFDKLGVSNRQNLIIRAHRHGIE